MSSSQVGKSEIINNTIGYFIDIDPCPILMVHPTIETAEDYSKRRIYPMTRDTEKLSQKVSESKSRDTNNTILMKSFPGGFLAIGGANSPAGLASRPIRVLLCDEVDRYPDSAGAEGDPIALAEKRTITFWNKKKLFVSTPTIKGVSRIEQEYELGTQEKWCVKCPGCGKYHFIVLRDIQFQYQKYESDKKITYVVESVRWRCPSCLNEYDEYVMKKQPAKWRAENQKAINNGIRSFRLNAFISPWSSWKEIIQEFLEVKNDPERFKVFVNTVLGETWEERGEFDDETVFLERREEYEADLPEGVLILTAAVDTQDDRLEYEVMGWGRDEESWGIEKGIIWGKPDEPGTWEMLDDKLTKTWYFANGMGLVIACTCIDSGGHYTEQVYKYCGPRIQSRVFPIKGQGGDGIPLVHKISRNNKYKLPLIMLGVDSGKTTTMQRLKIKRPGPKYCHFPVQDGRGYDQAYFKGLISEKQVPRKRYGQVIKVWENIGDKRNEPLDLRVYNLAAINLLKPNFEALERRLKEATTGTKTSPAQKKKPSKKKYGAAKKSAVY